MRIALLAILAAASATAADFASHPPMRPLPEVSSRPLGEGEARFVDPAAGSDAAAGTLERPWRSLAHGLAGLEPGTTLYLRGGVYYETVRARLVGTPEAPITVRSYPGELAVLDGGYREFAEDPKTAWEPFPGGASGEYRSVKPYPELAAAPDAQFRIFGSGRYSSEVRVLGNFADSMVPLHGYRHAHDLRSDSGYWKADNEDPVYCGPGLWLDEETERIHVRLAHTGLAAFGAGNYGGQTDPRLLPLVVGGPRPVLHLERSRHVRVLDLVIRGSRSRSVNVERSADVLFDGLTIYGGAPALWLQATHGFKLLHSALRGISAPWSSRACEKYKGISTYLFVADGRDTQNEDVEMAYSELTDCQDGLVVGTVNGLELHHNLVDNFSDDALYLTPSRGRPGRGVEIFQNRLSRCLTCFAFAGWGLGQEGTEAYVYRNVIDLRSPVHYWPPRGADEIELPWRGRLVADHGSPIWKPMVLYQNTIVSTPAPWRESYGAGLSTHLRGTRRWVFNNIFVHTEGLPGRRIGGGAASLESGGNLHWSSSEGEAFQGDFFALLRPGPAGAAGEGEAPPRAVGDLFADPQFAVLSADWRVSLDAAPGAASPALEAGRPLPEEWPDPLRSLDPGGPDVGALVHGLAPWRIGIQGRYPVTGTDEMPEAEPL